MSKASGGDYLTVSDGHQMFYRRLLPNRARGVCIILHGVGEHSGRYMHVLQALADVDLAVYAPDHRGHGMSGSHRGDLESMDRVLRDIRELQSAAALAHPGLTCFVLAHSMGAIIGQLYLLRHQDDLAGCVLSGSPTGVPDRISPIAVSLVHLIARVAPRLPVQKVAPIGMGSRDPEVVARSRVDPLCYNGPTMARTGLEMLSALEELDRRRSEITLPLLILHGGDDRIIPVDSATKVANSVSSHDVTRIIYPELFHEVFNEPEKEKVLKDTTDWIVRHL